MRCRVCSEVYESASADSYGNHKPKLCQPESLRDRFAMAALAGLLAGRQSTDVAGFAYSAADAMLAARKATP